MTSSLTRRKALVLGAGGAVVIAGGGLVWRAWDSGVFSVGEGPAYEPWHDWREKSLGGPMAVVRAGILAANAHNTQPWRFRVGTDRIALYADHDRKLGSFDPFRRELHLSLGCALENMAHAARAEGMTAMIEPAAGSLANVSAGKEAPVANVRIAPGEPEETDLYRAIPDRHTHRGSYRADEPLSAELLGEMQALLPEGQAIRLFAFTEGAERERLGNLIVSATEQIISDREMAADSARWFRFDWDAVQRARDGVTLDAVGLPPLVNAIAKMLPPPSAEEADQQWLETTREVHVATAPLLGMIAVKELYDLPTTLAAGQAWQRLHLWATARGLAAQPLNQPAEMVDRERELGQPARMAEALMQLTGDDRWRPTFVFRMGYADEAARLSPRRGVKAVVVG